MENSIAKDVKEGLSANPKWLSSQYFYDDKGSRIFQQIMAMPEYYLTNCEFEILNTRSQEIFQDLGFTGHFNVIELGAGDGVKTRELLASFLEAGADMTYVPIDISSKAISMLANRLSKTLPGLSVNPQIGDYFETLDKIEAQEECPNLVLFLGSNIGNYDHAAGVDLLKHINDHMRAGDRLLVGFDLQKNPNEIRNAYDDPHGITRDFNLNLLSRINTELGGDFKLDQFDFYCCYDPFSGEVKSYLVSLREQVVTIDSIGKKFHFHRDELISTEISKKYTRSEIEQMATESGFKFNHHYLDRKNYFTDTLFTKP
jgi:L-histidine N-alpha-methyltransferase